MRCVRCCTAYVYAMSYGQGRRNAKRGQLIACRRSEVGVHRHVISPARTTHDAGRCGRLAGRLYDNGRTEGPSRLTAVVVRCIRQRTNAAPHYCPTRRMLAAHRVPGRILVSGTPELCGTFLKIMCKNFADYAQVMMCRLSVLSDISPLDYLKSCQIL